MNRLALTWVSGCAALFSGLPAQACHIAWERFVTSASVENRNSVIGEIEACRRTGEADGPDDRQVWKLIRLVEDGNENGIDVAFRSLRFLDGGNLEDVVRQLGVLSESNPLLMLREVKALEFSDRQFEMILTMPQEEVIDDLEKRIVVVRKRIASLADVSDGTVLAEKQRALDILARYLTEVQRIQDRDDTPR